VQGAWVVGGNANLFVLPSSHRPSVDRRFVIANNGTMGFNLVQVSASSGQVSIVNGFTTTDNAGTGSTSSVDPVDNTTYNDAGWSNNSDAGWSGGDSPLVTTGHSHYTGAHSHYTGSHNHGVVGSHSHSGPNHSHSISPSLPGTVWFDSVEFFL
jgi:hypothetical protein